MSRVNHMTGNKSLANAIEVLPPKMNLKPTSPSPPSHSLYANHLPHCLQRELPGTPTSVSSGHTAHRISFQHQRGCWGLLTGASLSGQARTQGRMRGHQSYQIIKYVPTYKHYTY